MATECVILLIFNIEQHNDTLASPICLFVNFRGNLAWLKVLVVAMEYVFLLLNMHFRFNWIYEKQDVWFSYIKNTLIYLFNDLYIYHVYFDIIM